MNLNTILAAGVLAVAAAPAFAQPGETDPADCRPSSGPVSAADKASAREKRRAEGAQASKSTVLGDAQPCSAGTAGAATASQRREAAAKRRQDAAAALRQGQISSGEK